MTTSLKILLTELVLIIFFALLYKGSGKRGHATAFGLLVIVFVITLIIKIWL